MMAIYRPFGERNGIICVDNVSSLSSISCFWNFTAFRLGVRGCGIFFYKKCLTAKVRHSAEEIQADMRTAYECNRVNSWRGWQKGDQ
jgi:hypothetical protein